MIDVGKILMRAYHTEHSINDIITHICFLVMAAAAFFFMIECFAILDSQDIIFITEKAGWVINYLIGWSNIFLNFLFMLIIIEISQIIANAYWRYKRETL